MIYDNINCCGTSGGMDCLTEVDELLYVTRTILASILLCCQVVRRLLGGGRAGSVSTIASEPEIRYWKKKSNGSDNFRKKNHNNFEEILNVLKITVITLLNSFPQLAPKDKFADKRLNAKKSNAGV